MIIAYKGFLVEKEGEPRHLVHKVPKSNSLTSLSNLLIFGAYFHKINHSFPKSMKMCLE